MTRTLLISQSRALLNLVIMKTMINKSILLVASVAFIFTSCNKESETPIVNQPNNNIEQTIDENKIKEILSQINSKTELSPDWWERFKSWVKEHTGNSQKYQDGQPVCAGNGGCGPCAGICFNLSMAPLPDGNLSDHDYNNGLRKFEFGIVENQSTNELKVLLEFDANDNQIIDDGSLIILNDEIVSSELTSLTEYSSITLHSGNYPVFEDENGKLQTIVNATFN